jgi:hypothetical protein
MLFGLTNPKRGSYLLAWKASTTYYIYNHIIISSKVICESVLKVVFLLYQSSATTLNEENWTEN